MYVFVVVVGGSVVSHTTMNSKQCIKKSKQNELEKSETHTRSERAEREQH